MTEVFKEELDGYVCEVALDIGYRKEGEDYNAMLPKSKLTHEELFVHLLKCIL